MPEILIRGMEMPTKDSIIVAIRPDGKIEDVMGCYIGTAVELPPHGDLVDATQYRDEFMDGVYNMCADDPDNNRANVIIDLYDCAPVVIPAERRE